MGGPVSIQIAPSKEFLGFADSPICIFALGLGQY